MAKAKVIRHPTRQEISTFLACIDADSIAAKMAPKELQGLRTPEEIYACKNVYEWLQKAASGEWP